MTGQTPLRVLVTGSRHADDSHRAGIRLALNHHVAQLGGSDGRPVVIVQGECPKGGADLYAQMWAVERWADGFDIKAESHPAEAFGPWPACGPLRNSHMVGLGAHLCLAFPLAGIRARSRGTWDTIEKAIAAGITTYIYPLAVVS